MNMVRPAIALIGNPNTGKTTLFNALTGLRQRVANYPGVTVEQKIGELICDGTTVDLIDLPGTYSLAAQSPDEMIAVELLLGQRPERPPLRGIVAIVDASNLPRNLYLVSQLLECTLPVILVLNMTDVAERKGLTIQAARLQERLGIPVIPARANVGEGLPAVRTALTALLEGRVPSPPKTCSFPATLESALHELDRELRAIAPTIGRRVSRVEAARILIDAEGEAPARLLRRCPAFAAPLRALRQRATTNGSLASLEATTRYGWIRGLLQNVVRAEKPARNWTDRIDAIVTHKVAGTAILIGITAFVFQSIYAWAGPLMDLIDWCFGSVGVGIGRLLPAGALQSLLVDGIIKGVGSVLVFLPQIAILFFFLALLEDCGYMARAAFLMDKLLARAGLSGKSFIPLLSSFACAVPGIMATRTIENRRDRLATILVAPLMSCSARLPVYTILIAACIPATYLFGWLNLQGMTLFAMHALGLVVAIPVVWGLKRTILKGSTPPFVMELPAYKRPSLRLVAFRVIDRAKAFVRRAGTIICAMTIIVWALAYFPQPGTESALGQMGHWIEPAVRPLGWDWRIGMAALASFPAREVVIAALGTIYNIGSEVTETSTGLIAALRGATWPDGRLVYTLPVACSLMVFFALCCQCGATVATIRRETNSWGWAWFTFGYMTALAYLGAFVVYQGMMALGLG